MNKIYFVLILVFLFQKSFTEDEKKEVNKSVILPAVITEDLILKASKAPYITNGFKIPRGVTLTIEPGVSIEPDNSKGDSEPMLVEGNLIVGKKGGLAVTIEIPSTAEFSGATIEMHNVNFTSSTILFSGGTEGMFTGCTFTHVLTRKTNAPFDMNIPKRGVFTFSNCHFINHHINLPDNIQDAKEKIKFEMCAFSPRWDSKIDRYTAVNIDSNIFIVGNKCDLYAYIAWKKMNYDFNPMVKANWFIKDQSMKETLEKTVTSTKGFILQFSTPYTKFKPEPPKIKKQKD